MNLVIPLAGKDPHFEKVFKPFIKIDGSCLIEHVVRQHDLDKINQLIFIVLREHEKKYRVSQKLKDIFSTKATVCVLDELTRGSPCSIIEAAGDLINNKEDLLIDLGDVIRELSSLYRNIKNIKRGVRGIIPVDKKLLRDRRWGYIYLNKNGYARYLHEKTLKPRSQLATTGLYYFSHGCDFIWAAKKMIKNYHYMFRNNFFTGPCYNELIRNKKKVIVSYNPIKYLVLYPKDIKTYINNIV
ncbi:hypothetical protein A3F03_04930 [Candidatus Roizmanbacteria bacterium RIFCSPHIGHO2_12_FULL_41_11]|uniref:Nucleotidyl transferase domain-containing protein n=1 Tax=Candidatus Roizmanbacteria bacterium RIFCSPHIGHO2_12_FULL_41_11 TaxID=1802052 RepID=A0A1F7I4I5_9BACT|nr:MAG: hypothetical protein A3F03_04930 [Candidatus Roizmanbacteria bacterium RIFCSPHIGHO2_12_FULL_41_11]